MNIDYFDIKKLLKQEQIYKTSYPFVASGIIELDRIFLPGIGIHEFLMYPGAHCEDLLLAYAVTLAMSLPILIIDPVRFVDPDHPLLRLLPKSAKENILIIQNSFKTSIEKEIYDAVNSFDALSGIFILNAAALISNEEFNTPPQVFDRAGFSRFMLGLYKWLASKVPFIFVSNIAWSRKLSRKIKKDSPGGEFRKTIIKSLYKVEKVSTMNNFHLDIINIYTQDRPSEGIKIAYDNREGIFVSMEVVRLCGLQKAPRHVLLKANKLLKKLAAEYTFDSIVNNKSLAAFLTEGA